jgi:hypothetical protein
MQLYNIAEPSQLDMVQQLYVMPQFVNAEDNLMQLSSMDYDEDDLQELKFGSRLKKLGGKIKKGWNKKVKPALKRTGKAIKKGW